MIFTIQKSVLENALKSASRYTDKKHDVLKFVYLGVVDGKLLVRGTNQTEDSMLYLDCAISEDGDCLVDHNLLTRGLGRLSDDMIEVVINSKLQIKQGRKKVSIDVADAKQFPLVDVEDTTEVKFDSNIGDRLNYLSNFIGENTIMPWQSCVYIRSGYIAASDPMTKVLVYFTGADKDLDLLIPKRAIAKIVETSLLKPYVGIGSSSMVIKSENEVFVSKLVNDKARSFESILERMDNKGAISIPVRDFLDAIELATLDDDNIKMVFTKDALAVSGNGIESKNSSNVSVDIQCDTNGIFKTMANYLKVFLKNTEDDEVKFVIPEENLPGLFTDSKSSFIIMPTIKIKGKDD